jgi:hypothetical protein
MIGVSAIRSKGIGSTVGALLRLAPVAILAVSCARDLRTGGKTNYATHDLMLKQSLLKTIHSNGGHLSVCFWAGSAQEREGKYIKIPPTEAELAVVRQTIELVRRNLNIWIGFLQGNPN